MGYKSGNITNASNGATPKAHVAIKRGAGNAQTYIRQKTALKIKMLGV